MADGERIRVDRINRRKKGRPGEELEVVLADASSFFASMRVWEDGPFHEGDELSLDQLESIRRKSLHVAVRARALSLLTRSEHSRFLLDQKLRSRGFDPETCKPVLDELERTGMLDDSRYASSWVRDRVRRHPEGRGVLLGGLRARGVATRIAEASIDEVLSEESGSPESLARVLIERLRRNPRYEAHDVAVRMLRRGFDQVLVRRLVEEYFGHSPADDVD